MLTKEHSALSQSFLVKPNELIDYTQAIQKEWATKPCGPKGEVERFFERGAGFFPNRLLIPRMIVQTVDTEEVRNGLLKGIAQNCSMGVRAVAEKKLFGGEKLPWDMEITTENKVQNFFEETLPKWRRVSAANSYIISQLILMYNPPEIGTRAELPNQFVARVQKDDIIPQWFEKNNTVTNQTAWSRVLTEMTTGTNKLRGMDRFFNEGNEGVLQMQYVYGPTNILRSKTTQVGSQQFDTKTKALFHLELPDLSNEQRELSLGAMTKIDDIISDPDFQQRLNFFSSIGLNAIEFQGYRDTETGIVRAFIYGIRGPNDEATTVGFRPYDFESSSHSE